MSKIKDNSFVSFAEGYLLFDVTEYVNSLNLPKTLNGMELKDEFHISLLPAKRIVKSMTEDEQDQQLALKRFEEISMESLDTLGSPELDGRLYACEDSVEAKKTIIGSIDFPGLHDWQVEIKHQLGDIEFPFPHITLYTDANSKRGIALDEKHFLSFCKPISETIQQITLQTR